MSIVANDKPTFSANMHRRRCPCCSCYRYDVLPTGANRCRRYSCQYVYLDDLAALKLRNTFTATHHLDMKKILDGSFSFVTNTSRKQYITPPPAMVEILHYNDVNGFCNYSAGTQYCHTIVYLYYLLLNDDKEGESSPKTPCLPIDANREVIYADTPWDVSPLMILVE